MPGVLDPPVELGLQQLPDPVAVRSDDHRALRPGPRSTSCALVTNSLYQAEKSSLCGVTPRSSRATPIFNTPTSPPPSPPHGASRWGIELGLPWGACIFWPVRNFPPTTTTEGADRHALVTDPHSHAARGPGRRRRGEPPAAAARRVHPPAHGRALQHAAAGHAGPGQGHQRDPGGDEPDRRAGVPDALHAAGPAVGEKRPAGGDGGGDVPAHRPQGRGTRPGHDARGGRDHARDRAIVLPAAAAILVPHSDQVPRRAEAEERPDPDARVHDEGLVQLRRRRRRARCLVRGAPRRLPADLRPARHPGHRGRGVQRDHGRQRLGRVRVPVGRGRGPDRAVRRRRLRLRRQPGEGDLGAAADRGRAGPGRARAAADPGRAHHRRPGPAVREARGPADQDAGLRDRRPAHPGAAAR